VNPSNKGLRTILTTPANSVGEARTLGLKHYNGPLCVNGHPGLRYTTSGDCVDCVYERVQRARERVRLMSCHRHGRTVEANWACETVEDAERLVERVRRNARY